MIHLDTGFLISALRRGSPEDRQPVALLAADAGVAARLFNLAGRRRGSLNDCMIAATALRVSASLATTNLADFRRLEPAGLRVISAAVAGDPTAQ